MCPADPISSTLTSNSSPSCQGSWSKLAGGRGELEGEQGPPPPSPGVGGGGEQAPNGVPQAVQQGGEGLPAPEAARVEEEVGEGLPGPRHRLTGRGVHLLQAGEAQLFQLSSLFFLGTKFYIVFSLLEVTGLNLWFCFWWCPFCFLSLVWVQRLTETEYIRGLRSLTNLVDITCVFWSVRKMRSVL